MQDLPEFRPLKPINPEFNDAGSGQPSGYSQEDLHQARDELLRQRGPDIDGWQEGSAATQPVDPVGSIRGVGVGMKDPESSSEECVVVLVPQKLPETELGRSVIPRHIAGIPTDVITCGEIRAHDLVLQSELTVRAPNGAGVTAVRDDRWSNSFSTLGGLCVREAEPDTLCFITNAHMFRDFFASRNTFVATTERKRIGRLSYWSRLRIGDRNFHDAALVRTGPEQVSGGPISATTERPRPGMSVQKIGWKSGTTQGVIRALGVEFIVNYGLRNVRFSDMIAIQGLPVTNRFSVPGDAGALVVGTSSQGPIGLLFGGDNSGGLSFASAIDPIIRDFQIGQFVGVVEPPA